MVLRCFTSFFLVWVGLLNAMDFGGALFFHYWYEFWCSTQPLVNFTYLITDVTAIFFLLAKPSMMVMVKQLKIILYAFRTFLASMEHSISGSHTGTDTDSMPFYCKFEECKNIYF